MKHALILGVLSIPLLVVLGALIAIHTVRLDGAKIKKNFLNNEANTFVDEQTLLRYVETFDALGPHRTGSAGDLATTDWIQEELTGLGFRVQRQAFSLPSFEVDQAGIELGGKFIKGFPQFPVTPSAPEVTGLIVPATSHSDELQDAIAFLTIESSRRNNSLSQSGLRDKIHAATRSGANAVLLMIEAECKETKVLNAPIGMPHWDVPVLVIGEQWRTLVEQTIRRRDNAKLLITGEAFQPTAYNLVAEIGPSDQAPVVISTPQSAWFHSTAERGSGVAAFLGLAHWAASRKNQRFVLVSNSGHERGNFGAEKFLQEYAPPPSQVSYWFHIGANIGALEPVSGVNNSATVNQTRYLMTSLSTYWDAVSAYQGQPGLQNPIPLALGLAQGELAAYHRAGYAPLTGAFGPSAYHHCANDRTPMVSLTAIRETIIATAMMVDRITNQ